MAAAHVEGRKLETDPAPDRIAILGLRPQLRQHGISEVAVGQLDPVEPSGLEGFDDIRFAVEHCRTRPATLKLGAAA